MTDRHYRSIERIAVAQIGARRHYAVPRALQSRGNLDRLYTDFYWPDRFESSTAGRWAGQFFERLRGRRVDGVSSEKVSAFAGFYLRRLLQRRLATRGGGGREAELRQWLQQNGEFGRLVCAADFDQSADAIYAFNGAAWETFDQARQDGLFTILDQTTPALRFEESVVAEECQRWPEWEAARTDSAALAKILDISILRENAEWNLADRIVCGSQFAADTLSDVSADRIRVVPYPSPISPSASGLVPKPSALHDGPLRVLFAGTLGLRKGLPWLVEAVAALQGAVELRLVGPSQLLPKKVSELSFAADIRGAVSRSEMKQHYEWADVLVLPTLSEGSANVCHEAMAAARAVITTPNAGSVVRDGIDGRVIPARDSAAIASALQQLIDSPALVAEWGASAFEQTSSFTFERYANALLAAIQCSSDLSSKLISNRPASTPKSVALSR